MLPFPTVKRRIEALFRLQAVHDEIVAIAREEQDPTMQQALSKGVTVLGALCHGLLGGYHEELLDPLWKTARRLRGSSAVLTANRRDMEDAFEILTKRIAAALPHQDLPNVVTNALIWMHIESPLGPAQTSDRSWTVYQAVLNDRGLRSKRQQSDPEAIARAVLRACGYRLQVGARKHAKSYRHAQKKRAPKTRN